MKKKHIFTIFYYHALVTAGLAQCSLIHELQPLMKEIIFNELQSISWTWKKDLQDRYSNVAGA